MIENGTNKHDAGLGAGVRCPGLDIHSSPKLVIDPVGFESLA